MKGFIEVTNLNNSNKRVLISIESIQSIEEGEKGKTHIGLLCVADKKPSNPWTSIGFMVSESYAEVLEKIKEATSE